MTHNRFFILSSNKLVAKKIENLCVSSDTGSYQITMKKNLPADDHACDIILIAEDQAHALTDEKLTSREIPVIYLSEHDEQTINGCLIRQYVDEIIDMRKITVSGFFRAVVNASEKFYIKKELSEQKAALTKLIGTLQEIQPDKKNEVIANTETTAKNMLEENKLLIEVVQKQNEELKTLILIDALTRVGNRRNFEETLTKMISHAQRHKHMVALLMIDLDKFKNVNDSYGHQVGDVLLQQVAERLQRSLRRGDFIARLGGDEFAIILNEIKNPHAAGIVAWKTVKEISNPFLINDLQLSVEVSIGISCFPLIGDTCSELIKNADIAMYQAKKSHTLRYAFASMSIQTDYVKKEKLKDELKSAIAQNELSLVYQPIYEIPSRKLYGFEALIRWENKSLGKISPAEFIPIAEESGLIHPISKWVMQSVCKQILQWKNGHDFPYKISINLSPSQLIEGNLVHMVNEIFSSMNISLKYIDFEITEMAAMQESDVIISIMKTLTDMGASYALDNFGSGYSSIKHLRFLPVSTIKIDQSFVHGIGKQKIDENIVSSIISLAKKIGLKVVAEGVETEEQLNALINEKCDYVQGFYFSVPLTVPQATTLLESENKK